MPKRHIAIVGYGTAGQACAHALAGDDVEVEIFERVAEPGPVGAGFLLQPIGLQALWRMGLLDEVRRYGAPVARLYGENTHGRVVMDMRYADLDPRLGGLGMQRGALFSILHAAIGQGAQLHAGTAIEEIDHASGRIRDHQGRWHGPYDLVIVAEGSASRLRESVAAPRINQPYPWGALWCLLPAGDWRFSNELSQRYLLARQMMGFLPVGSAPADGTPKLSFFWSLPSDGFEDWQRAGPDAWFDQLTAIWPEARTQLGDGFDVGVLARAAYRDAVLRDWWQGRTVLVGDAAHAMSPQLGQGANMALVDAVALADALRSTDRLEQALAEFTAARRRHLAAYHRWSRWLTPLFQSNLDWLARLRDLAFFPAGKLPGGRGHMLRVLTGTQQGWLCRYPLQPAFIEAWMRK